MHAELALQQKSKAVILEQLNLIVLQSHTCSSSLSLYLQHPILAAAAPKLALSFYDSLFCPYRSAHLRSDNPPTKIIYLQPRCRGGFSNTMVNYRGRGLAPPADSCVTRHWHLLLQNEMVHCFFPLQQRLANPSVP